MCLTPARYPSHTGHCVGKHILGSPESAPHAHGREARCRHPQQPNLFLSTVLGVRQSSAGPTRLAPCVRLAEPRHNPPTRRTRPGCLAGKLQTGPAVIGHIRRSPGTCICRTVNTHCATATRRLPFAAAPVGLFCPGRLPARAHRPAQCGSLGAPARVWWSCWFCFSLLERPMSPFSFFPLVSLFVHLRSSHVVFGRPPSFPLPPLPTFYLRFSHHSHSLGTSIRSILWIRSFLPDSTPPVLASSPCLFAQLRLAHPYPYLTAQYNLLSDHSFIQDDTPLQHTNFPYFIPSFLLTHVKESLGSQHSLDRADIDRHRIRHTAHMNRAFASLEF